MINYNDLACDKQNSPITPPKIYIDFYYFDDIVYRHYYEK